MKLHPPPSPSGAIGYWGGNTKLNGLIVVDPGKTEKDGVSVAPKVRCLDEQVVTTWIIRFYLRSELETLGLGLSNLCFNLILLAILIPTIV